MSTVYLNGEYVACGDAVVSVNDRGFLLGDACYEATPVYQGTPFRLGQHLDRLRRGLELTRIGFDPAALIPVHDELIRRNGLGSCELALVYLHVTRGVAPRAHAFPDPPVTPTVYAFAKEVRTATDEEFEAGAAAITHPDPRWLLPSIKATGLLGNVLAQQAAVDAGATDVVLHRDGRVTEGSHNNVFVVERGTLVTAPADDLILHGVTRAVVLELAREDGLAVEEVAFDLDRLRRADEVFFTSATTEIRATVRLDGRPVGDGSPGPVTGRLRQLLRARIALECIARPIADPTGEPTDDPTGERRIR
jgi:D-alanine transaminase